MSAWFDALFVISLQLFES